MSTLKQSLTKTLRYAAIFNYQLSLSELHHWLINDQPYSLTSISRLVKLPDISPQKDHAAALTQKKLAILRRLLPLLRLLPSIRLVALTGSLAMNNAKPKDDIDLMIITSPHTLWLTRPLIFCLLRLLNVRRTNTQKHISDRICDNLWLDTQALKVPAFKQNLYTAHEVLQVKPLIDRGQTYQRFITANAWTKKYLCNAYLATRRPIKKNKLSLLPSLATPILSPLNFFAFLFQYLYMRSKITNEYITLHSAYFHPRTYSLDKIADK